MFGREKENFLDYKNKIFHSLKNRMFLTMFLVKIRLEIMLNKVLDRKKIFDYKNEIFQSLNNGTFLKGINPWFWSKHANFFFICFQSEKNMK